MENGKRLMRIGIVGWGIEGQSAFHLFGPDNDYLIASEEPRSDFPPETERLKIQHIAKNRDAGLTGNVKDLSYLKGLENCDKIVYTPVSYKNLQTVFGDNQNFWAKATTALHIFFERCAI